MRRRSPKKEEKIDPNWFGDEISSKTQDLLSVITNRAMSWLFTSRWYQIKKGCPHFKSFVLLIVADVTELVSTSGTIALVLSK
jgi:hypothetical protein